MTTSRIPAVIDALVSTLKAAMPNALVFDGPFTTTPDRDYLVVGWTPEGENPSGSQTWAGVGNRARYEQIDIPCYCNSYSGSVTVSTRRNAAFALLSSAETALRADPMLGSAVPEPGHAQIGTYTAYQEQTEQGLAVGVIFHVLVTTQI